jgi:hypothetical protein
MMSTRRIVLNISFVAMLVLYLGVESIPVLASAKKSDPDLCDEICTLDVSCDTECGIEEPELPIFYTDCGTVTDGQCGNDCDLICTPETDGGTSCNGFGEEVTTCEDYGVYLHCGDGYCAKNYFETCGNCSADCICTTPTVTPSPIDPSDGGDLCGALSAGGSTRTCHPTVAAGGPDCDAKWEKEQSLLERLQNLDEYINWLYWLKDQCQCNAYDAEIASALAESFSKTSDYLASITAGCFPHGG